MTTEKNPESVPASCPVESALAALRAQVREFDGAAASVQRTTLASAARIVTEISLGRGTTRHLDDLSLIAIELANLAPAVANDLATSLVGQRDEWVKHIADHACTAGVCIKPRYVPCQEACPAHIDIPSVLANIAHAQYKDALDVLLKDTPLPNSCGLVCPAPCENACVQKTVSAAIVIRPMKSVAARCSGEYPKIECAPATGKKVAIVGAGPGGLTAAYYLAQKGHHCEIFDERPEPGGIMRYGIPNYRLPAEILNSEINMVKGLGVEIHNGVAISNVKELKNKGFDAVFLATGLQNSKSLGVPGEDQPFVLGGMDFLRKVRNGQNPQVGPHVIVIGGGNVAIDVAMTSFRQGATKVQIWYRRTRDVMPANPHEVQMALDEGVELIELWAPTQVLPGNQIEFARSKLAADFATAKNVIVRADHIIAGIGQDSDLAYLEGCAVETKWGNIVNDPVTLMTGEPGVFTGGDIAHGGSTVVAAIGSAKRAAESIHAYLTGGEMDLESLLPQRRSNVTPVRAGTVARTKAERPHVPEKEPLQRRVSHDAVLFDFDENVARVEASRCLRCDQCIGCGLCELVCTEVGAEALRMVEIKPGRYAFENFTRPADKCIGCGACAAVCPTGAITVETIGNERVTTITGTEVRRQPLLACSVCATPYITAAQHAAMNERLGVEEAEPCVCPSCAKVKTGNAMLAMPW